VVCVVDVDGVGPAAARAGAGWSGLPTFYMPFLSEPSDPVPPPAARQCAIRLAAALMGAATNGQAGAK
jgi:hypothetical protein